jgi:FkbM family methyltransferase
MFHSIQTIKNNGYCPDVIFDIGSYHGKWTQECLAVYPNSVYHLFDGNHHEEIEALGKYKNIHIHRNTILNQSSGQVNWYENKGTGDSIFKEKTHFYENTQPTKRDCVSLNEYAKEHLSLSEAKSILIKIDAQGAELNILKGSTEILAKTDFILMELPVFGEYNEGAPKFIDYINYMDNIGFIPYCIGENIYSKGQFNVQTNVIFVKKQHELTKLVQNTLMGGAKVNHQPLVVSAEKVNKHTTVLTYCSGYPYEVFLRFADTLYLTGFSGNLIFVVNQQDVTTLEKLMSIHPKVSYFVDTVNVRRQCQQKRYFIFKEILANLKTDHVLLADSRDLFFQRNIEEYELPLNTDVVFAGEGQIIEKDNLNKKWLSTIENDIKQPFIENIQHNKIVCSGTTYGTLEGIKKYINHMCNLMVDKVPTDYAGLDQGMHNYLIYSNTMNDFRFKVLPVTNVFFNTLIFGFKWIVGQDFVNNDKEISYIVHQWDRMPSYMKDRLNSKFKDRGYKFN